MVGVGQPGSGSAPYVRRPNEADRQTSILTLADEIFRDSELVLFKDA